MKSYALLGLLCLWWSVLPSTNGTDAKLVLLTDAAKMGAVCLDGTPPGYYYRQGTGSGMTKWIIHLQGGGWCYNEDSCVGRSHTALGSSKFWKSTASFNGLLSDDKTQNPDFYDWNLAHVNYCDGASFAGNVEKVVNWKGTDLHFRGFKILQTTMDSLKKAGMDKATEVILTGCSAGGLATYLHADYVKSVVPSGAMYHAIADAGYFIDAPSVNGTMMIRDEYSYVFKMQNCSGGVNQDCIKAYEAQNETWRCFFAQYTEPHISSAFFGLNSQYDTWQLGNILHLPCSAPKCTPDQMKLVEKFGDEFKSAASQFVSREGRGYFFDSCLIHCQSLGSSWNSIMVGGQSARETFGNWYFNRTSGKGQEVDCAYPCNKSC